MATTTSNFGWPIPQSTDLVKDGATAIASLGSGVDTSMAELKGGTTGQILSKTSNTDMDFTWINNDQGDITGVTAGTGLTGGGTSGSVTLAIDPDYYLLANQARRNAVLNSNFSVWQRGTSFTIASSTFTYIADRWQIYRAATGCTVTRQATGDTTNLPNIQYAMRIARDSGNTSTSIIYSAQSMESINSIPFAGKQVTFSFYARAGANYSAAGNTLNAYLYSGTGTDQNVLSSGYTGQSAVVSLPATLTTTWQRFTGTGTIASTATELGVYYTITPVGTAGAADYVEITGVQLELGSAANTYMPNQPTYQGELAACQRYYWRIGQNTDTYSAYSLGFASSTTNAFFVIPHPVNMRVKPTSLDYSTLLLQDGTTGLSVSSAALSQQNEKFSEITATVTGATAFRPYRLINNNSTNGYIGFNAEL